MIGTSEVDGVRGQRLRTRFVLAQKEASPKRCPSSQSAARFLLLYKNKPVELNDLLSP